MTQIEISLPSQLAEAERILRHTKQQHEKVKAEGRTITADKALVLITREAIVATLRQRLHEITPLN